MDTTIKISDKNRKRLEKLKIHKRQSYDEVIEIILDEVEKEEYSKEEGEKIFQEFLKRRGKGFKLNKFDRKEIYDERVNRD